MRRPLKQPDEMFHPDERSTQFVRHGACGVHPKTLESHHADIAALDLADEVPESIRDEFDTVRNLYLYSWYVYDFTVPATLYTHALIEKAIKEKCRLTNVRLGRTPRLRKLLNLCIRRGWLVDADFRSVLASTREVLNPAADDSEPPTFRPVPRYRQGSTNYCEHLSRTLPELRNLGAHGASGLGFPASALHRIAVTACIVNALFSEKVRGDPKDAPQMGYQLS